MSIADISLVKDLSGMPWWIFHRPDGKHTSMVRAWNRLRDSLRHQVLAQDFPQCIARKIRNELHDARDFEICKPLAAVVDNFLFLTGFAGYHDCLHYLFAEIAWNSDDNHLLNFGKGRNYCLDLERVYLSPCARNQPRSPPLDVKVTPRVFPPNIAWPEESMPKLLLAQLGLPKITVWHRGALDRHLAHLVLWNSTSVFVQYLDADVLHRQTHRIQRRLQVEVKIDCRGTDFGCAVELADVNPECLSEFSRHGGRQRRPGGENQTQRIARPRLAHHTTRQQVKN